METTDIEVQIKKWKDLDKKRMELNCQKDESTEWNNRAVQIQLQDVYKEMNSIETNLRKVKIEIKHPEKIIGARVTTGYRGKLDTVDCNVLTKLNLSPINQVGNVILPYEFKSDGSSELGRRHSYRIERVEAKVFITADQLLKGGE